MSLVQYNGYLDTTKTDDVFIVLFTHQCVSSCLGVNGDISGFVYFDMNTSTIYAKVTALFPHSRYVN